MNEKPTLLTGARGSIRAAGCRRLPARKLPDGR